MKRREGSITQRGPTSWLLKFELGSENGKRKIRYETVRAANRAAAQRILTARLADRDAGTLLQPSKTTVVELANDTSTDASYTHKFDLRAREIVRLHVAPFFGTKTAQEIRPADISAWQRELRMRIYRNQPLAAATLRQISKLLRAAFKRAAKEQLIARDPTVSVDLPKAERQVMTILTAPQLAELLKKLTADTRLSMSRLMPLTFAAAHTGARLGELAAMRWQDIDFTAAEWNLQHSFEQIGRELAIRPCKNAASRRVISLAPGLVAFLKDYKTTQAIRLLAQGHRQVPSDLVFDNGRGAAVSPNTTSSNWSKALRRLSFEPQIKFHSLRHWHASVLIASRINILEISRRLGHANVNTTLTIYGHLMDRDDRAAAAAIDAKLAGHWE